MAELLLEAGVMFAALAAAGGLARRVSLSVIPLYILSGMVLGEHVLGRAWTFHVTESAFVDVAAELGIVFLLFFLGLEFNLDRLLAARDRIGTAGVVDLVVNFGAGLVVGAVLFEGALAAFLVAGIVYISSSAIITKSLIDLGWIANAESEPMLGTLVFEDLFIAVYLAVATALVLGGGDPATAVRSVAVAVGFILALLVLAYYGDALFDRLLRTSAEEHVVLRTVGATTLVAGAALAVGVSEAVAAFFVGMAFAATDHADEVEGLLEPVRDVFAAVFFFWIGLVTDPAVFGGVAAIVALAAVATTPTKLLSGYLGGQVYGLNPRRSLRVGLGMVTRGEFSLIIAALALSGAGRTLDAAVADRVYAFAVGYVLVMSVLGTVLMQYSGAVESRLVPLLPAPAE